MAETTPNLGLKKPIRGEKAWDVPLRETIDALDQHGGNVNGHHAKLHGHNATDGSGTLAFTDIDTDEYFGVFARDFGVVGDGSDVTAELQDALNSTPTDATLVLPGPTLGISDTIVWPDRRIRMQGFGPEGKTKLQALSGFPTDGRALLDLTTAATTQHVEIEGIGIDLGTADNGRVGLDLDRLDQARFRRIKVRGGAIGMRVGFCTATYFDDITIFNPADAGIQIVETAAGRPVTIAFNDCLLYLTGGAVAAPEALIDIQQGEDIKMMSCRLLRSPTIAHRPKYGIKAVWPLTNPKKFSALHMVNTDIDGFIGDGSVGSAVHLENGRAFRMIGCHMSGYSAADAAQVPGLSLVEIEEIVVADSRISGTGVTLGGNIKAGRFRDNWFLQQGGGYAFTLLPGATLDRFDPGENFYNDPTKVAAAAAWNTIVRSGNSPRGPMQVYTSEDELSSGDGLFMLFNATAGTKKAWRVGSGATGTLQLINNLLTGVIFEINDSGIIGVGGSASTWPTIRAGDNSPEGVVTANPGSVFLRKNGGANTTIYIKESAGTLNTGWRAL